MKQTETNYEQQAIEFANKYGVVLQIGTPTYGRHFEDDTQSRYIFPCKLKRDGKSYSFKFGQSIADGSNEPTMYDILACLTKNDPEDYDFFCDNYGYAKYDEETGRRNKSSYKIYLSVVKEWEGVQRLFGDILDELQEIN